MQSSNSVLAFPVPSTKNQQFLGLVQVKQNHSPLNFPAWSFHFRNFRYTKTFTRWENICSLTYPITVLKHTQNQPKKQNFRRQSYHKGTKQIMKIISINPTEEKRQTEPRFESPYAFLSRRVRESPKI